MALSDIDRALAQWENRLESAAHNLFDLQNDPTYQCLTGTAGAPKTPLSGITAAKISPAIDNVGTLFQCFDLLRCTIDRAVRIRRELPSLFGGEQKEREIQQLLFAKSVRVPTDQIPMAHRTLLTGADELGCISPEQLLNTMVKAFETARDALTTVDRTWRELGSKLGDATRLLAALRSTPEKLEDAETQELDGVEHALKLRRAQLQSDPLGTSLDLDSVVLPVLARVQTSIQERARLRTQTEDALRAARARLQELLKLHREAGDAWREAQEKISGAELSPPLPEARIDSLREWLDRLQERFEGGLLRPVSVGLQNWNSVARDCVSDEQRTYSANSVPLELRNELRGRLNALKAKAQAYRVEEDADLRALAAEAEGMLYTRPTPIDRAGEAVTRYQSALSERTQAKPSGSGPRG